MDSAPTYPPRSRHRNARTLKTTLIAILGGLLLAITAGAGGYFLAYNALTAALDGYIMENCTPVFFIKECIVVDDGSGVVLTRCSVEQKGKTVNIAGTI